MTTASVKTTTGLERRMEIEVPASRVQQEVDRRLRDVGRTARLPGFRPGKVPATVVRQRFGEQVHQEAVDELVRRSFAEAVIEQKLSPAGGPRIEPISTLAGQDLKYAAVFEVYPEIKLQGLDKLAVERPVTEVTDADVDAMIEQLRKQLSDRLAEWKKHRLEAAQKEAQTEAAPEGSEASAASAASEGSEASSASTASSGSEAATSGAAKVDDSEIGPLTDEEFFEAYGVKEGGLPELKRQVADNMRREVEQNIELQVKSQLLDALLKANPVELPKALVEAQVNDMLVDYARRTGIREVSQLPPREQFQESASRRVTLGLLIGELVKAEKLQPDAAKVQSRLERIVSQAHNAHGHHHADPEEHRRHEQQMMQAYRQDQNAMQQIESMVLEEQAIEWLLQRAKTTEKRKTFKELTNFGA